MPSKKRSKSDRKLSSEEDADKRRLLYVRQVAESLERPDSLVSVTVAAYARIIDQLIGEVAADVHRAAATDSLPWISVPEELAEAAAAAGGAPPQGAARFPLPSRPEADSHLFEQVECQHCQRRLAACRFAPHLEKCLLGKGRNARGSKMVRYTE